MLGNNRKDISEEEAADQAQKYAGKVNEGTVSDLVGKEDKITGLFEKVEALKKYWDDVCEVFALIKDRIGGVYTDTPWPTIASLAGALLYVFSPLDCIPDFIPVAGFLDDASVFGFVIMSVNVDLMKYRTWKSKHGGQPEHIEAVAVETPKVAGLLPAAAPERKEQPEEATVAEVTDEPPSSDRFLELVKSAGNRGIGDLVRHDAGTKKRKKKGVEPKAKQEDWEAAIAKLMASPDSTTVHSAKASSASAPAAPKRSAPTPPPEEWTVPCDRIREVVLSFKTRHSCNDIVMPEAEKFSRKWSNIAGVIREKLGKTVREIDAIAIIDCTVFGSAKDGALIDGTGLYLCNDWPHSKFNGFVGWDLFRRSGTVCKAETFVVQLCAAPAAGLSMAGSDIGVEKGLDLFRRLHEAVAGDNGNVV